MVRTGQFAAIFSVLAAASAWAILGVPVPVSFDPTFYFQNAEFLRTGHYVWGHSYPSFTGPNPFFYPLGGYSLWVAGMRALEGVTGIGWFFWLKAFQFAMFLHAGWLVFAIGSRLGRPLAGVAAAILYFAYFPFLNAAGLIMSETLGIWLLLLAAWLFLKAVSPEPADKAPARPPPAGDAGNECPCVLPSAGTGCHGGRRPKALFAGLAFFLAGYSMLVRPILGMTLPLLFVAAAIVCRRRWRLRTWCVLAALLAACPAAQSLWNHAVFGNYRIRSGSALNFYNRIIFQDQSVPRPCPYQDAIDHTVYHRGRTAWYGGWWDLAADLSPRGCTKEQVEDIAGQIAWAGLRQNKARDRLQTLEMSAWLAVTHAPPEFLYRDEAQCLSYIRAFGRDDRPEAMLSRDLIRQEDHYARSPLAAASLAAYNKFGELYDLLADLLRVQYVFVAGYSLWLAAAILRVCRPNGLRHVPALAVAILPILILVGSCMAEVRQVRYRLLAEPLLLLGFALGMAELGDLLWRNRNHPTNTTGQPRGMGVSPMRPKGVSPLVIGREGETETVSRRMGETPMPRKAADQPPSPRGK